MEFMNARSVKDFEFKSYIAKGDVLALFVAPWAGPCTQVDVRGVKKMPVISLDIDENPQTPELYGVRGIPLYVWFRDGKPVDSKVGLMSPEYLKEWLGD